MSHFQSTTMGKTKKDRQCHACLKLIYAGTFCEKTFLVEDDAGMIYMHIECSKELNTNPEKYLEDEAFQEGCLVNRWEGNK